MSPTHTSSTILVLMLMAFSTTSFAALIQAARSASGLPSDSPTNISPKKVSHYALDGCGENAGQCVAIESPAGCLAKRNCEFAMSTMPDTKGTDHIFNLYGKFQGYVAIALAEDAIMGNDSVVECIRDQDGTVGAYMSVNRNKEIRPRNQRLPQNAQDGIELIFGAIIDNAIICSFRRKQVTTVEGKTYDLKKGTWYLQLATGNKINDKNGTNVVGHHQKWTETKNKVSLLSNKETVLESTYSKDKNGNNAAESMKLMPGLIFVLLCCIFKNVE